MTSDELARFAELLQKAERTQANAFEAARNLAAYCEGMVKTGHGTKTALASLSVELDRTTRGASESLRALRDFGNGVDPRD